MAHDTDAFARWEAGQQLATGLMLNLVAATAAGQALVLDDRLVEGMARTLASHDLDQAFKALALALPAQAYLAQQMEVVDVEGIEQAHTFVRGALGQALRDVFFDTYNALNQPVPYAFNADEVGRRSLKNACLAYLMRNPQPDVVALAMAQFDRADNMTDSLAALSVLVNAGVPERDEVLEAFYRRWSDNALVVDKWLSVQAMSEHEGALDQVRNLMAHEAFSLKNPNKVRALIGAFSQGNPARFHQADGGGYALLADVIWDLDGMNPQVAARLMGGLNQWRRYDPVRQALMRGEIERVLSKPDVSKDVYEIASKSLADA